MTQFLPRVPMTQFLPRVPTTLPGLVFLITNNPTPKHMLRPDPGHNHSHMGYGAAVYGWGRGSGVFSICMRRSF
jgi:hypothetical protein